ncbi:MAG: hypothetical protein ABW216_18660, partial [Candidatus Rokuibacteriota bacterium]
KSTYYLRSRPATRIAKATVEIPSTPAGANAGPDGQPSWTPTPPGIGLQSEPADTSREAAAIACSLENPESCEACQ